MKTFAILSVLLIGVTGTIGCSAGMTETPTSEVSRSPVISPAATCTGTPVTISRYVDTSATTQVK